MFGLRRHTHSLSEQDAARALYPPRHRTWLIAASGTTLHKNLPDDRPDEREKRP